MDRFEISGIIDRILFIRNKYGEKAVIDNFEKNILKAKNPELSYCFLIYIDSADVKAHSQVAIDSKDLKWNLEFAQLGKTDTDAHAQVILESKDPDYNYDFAYRVEGADIKALEKVVLDSKDPEWNYKFAKEVKGADIFAHRKVVMEGYSFEWKNEFDRLIGKDIRIIDNINTRILSLNKN